MAAEAFLDTNVLLYLLSADARKADLAEALVATGGSISVQVLNEFTSVARRKLRLDWATIAEVLDAVRATCAVLPLTEAVHDNARRLAAALGFSIYDSVIAASALHAGCTVLHTEDLQHNQRIGGTLRVNNPFR